MRSANGGSVLIESKIRKLSDVNPKKISNLAWKNSEIQLIA